VRVKHVPAAPDDLAFVEDAQRAVPLVPDSQDDCCARILERTDLVSRDEAATWLTFLRGLGLVERGPSGYSRIRRDPDPEFLREAFLTGVFGAEDVLDTLRDAGEPRTPPETFERVRDGQTVAHVSGGDPNVYGKSDLVYTMAEAEDAADDGGKFAVAFKATCHTEGHGK
jgi:hypothetical protein